MILRRILAVMLGLSVLSGCGFLPGRHAANYTRDLYKRIPYETEGGYRIINIFYATDRVVKDKKGKSPRFLPKMGTETKYGLLKMRISPDLKIETMLPKRLKKKGWVRVHDIIQMDEKTFMSELGRAVKESPYNSLLVSVEGFKDNFELTAIKTASFVYLLDVNTPFLLFDWPGDQSVTPWGYEKARTIADASGPYLGDLLVKVIREIKPERLWVESSSLGCQVACSAFSHMYKQADLADPEIEISGVVLSAPDVRKNDFDDTFKDEIAALSQTLTAYVSSDDRALLLTQIIDFNKRLGRQKGRVEKYAQFEEAKDLLYLKSLMPDRVSIVDVTAIDTASYRHGYYLESPAFFDDFYLRLFGAKRPLNRNLYLTDAEGGVNYWVLRDGK